ncbi:hypothetical protein GOB87_04920 [Acetobacter estunensis]|uniref:Uncharacterized protein n=1 Tax=Acetobacter estunensis TaxID=104097 RepID=A0A967EII6_9PROT|nr:hypothetical protein [Acetobacter estunensis]NHO53304.1 hypothetical protein [Acetobacter estunensis]
MSQTLLFRAGLPFAVVVCVDGSDGNPADLSGCSFASQIRDALGTLVATLTAEIVPDQVGVVQLRAADTTQWPLGQLWCDLDVTWPNGVVMPTEVFSITMRRGVTR